MFIELLAILLVTKAVINSSTSTNVVVATLLLLLVVVPLHITSTVGMFLFFLLIGTVFGSRARKLAMVCVAVPAVVTSIYLVYAAEPFFAFYFAIKAVLSTISELLQYGSLAITYLLFSKSLTRISDIAIEPHGNETLITKILSQYGYSV